jgi:hypothetical protein
MNRTRAIASNAGAELTAAGPLLRLPAGSLSLSLRAGIDRDTLRGSGDGFEQWSRELGAGLQIPIAGSGFLEPLGELHAGVQLTRTHVSGTGALTNTTMSLQWRPADWLRVFGSVTTGRSPPAVGLIAAPLLATPGVRTIDPLTGESVDVTEITGGNPDLGAQRAASRRLSIQVKPLRKVPLTLTSEYSAMRNRDLVTILPTGSDLLLLAFPERFVRGGDGSLTQIDTRPVSFARQSEAQLRSALDLHLPLPGVRPGARIQLNVGHTWVRKSELQIREGLGTVDLLSGTAIALGGGGRPRHELDFTLGYAERGLGLRLSGQYRGSSRLGVSGSSDLDSNVLRFSPLTSFSLRGFVDGSRLLPNAGALAGTRLTLSVLNLTNARQQVRDSRGETPLRYQPAYQDPTGRTVQLELRKAF